MTGAGGCGMARTESVGGAPRPDGWDHKSFHYGRVHGWLHPDGLRAAFVKAGPDSQARAAALVDGLPVDGKHHAAVDALARYAQDAAWAQAKAEAEAERAAEA